MIPWYILAGVNLGWLFVFEACETENDLLYKNPLILCWHAECEQLFIVHSYSYHMNYFKGGCGIMFFIRTVFLPWSQALHIIKSAADWWHCLVSMAWKQCSGKKCLHVPVAVQCVCYTMLVFHVMMQEAGVWNLMFCGVKDIYQNEFLTEIAGRFDALNVQYPWDMNLYTHGSLSGIRGTQSADQWIASA